MLRITNQPRGTATIYSVKIRWIRRPPISRQTKNHSLDSTRFSFSRHLNIKITDKFKLKPYFSHIIPNFQARHYGYFLEKNCKLIILMLISQLIGSNSFLALSSIVSCNFRRSASHHRMHTHLVLLHSFEGVCVPATWR